MSEVVLSSAVRANLLNLQSTAELLGKTQNRLATGKKVNSALDNPTNFFTANSLNSRASDLGRLLDSVSNAIQTIAAADKGISAITKLVESAQATARQALQAAVPGSTTPGGEGPGTDPVTAVATGSETFTGVATLTGTADLDGFDFSALEGTLDITINGQQITFTFGDTDPADGTVWVDTDGLDESGFLAALNDDDTGFGAGTFSIDGDDALVITGAGDITVAAGSLTESLLGAADDETEVTAAAAYDLGAALAGNLKFSVGDEEFDIDLDGLDALEDVVAALNGDADFAAVATASVSSSGALVITATNEGEDITFDTDDSASEAIVTALGLTDATAPADGAGDGDGDGGAAAPTSKRASLLQQYNDLLGQITALASDASFNGVNLLNGDTLSVLFNEDGSSKLDITGVTFSATGLGLTEEAAGVFDTNAGINGVLDKLKAATDTLRTQASKFGSNLSVVEARQNFTKEMINVLETGAANLTLADTNEEAANLLALQTRQQLSSTALSLASQADQNVLRLF
jgi:flagellin